MESKPGRRTGTALKAAGTSDGVGLESSALRHFQHVEVRLTKSTHWKSQVMNEVVKRYFPGIVINKTFKLVIGTSDENVLEDILFMDEFNRELYHRLKFYVHSVIRLRQTRSRF